MNRDVCEHFNPVDLPCDKCSVQKSTLREAAQQALEALESAEVDPHSSDAVYKAITALRDALANYDAELAEIDSDGARCGVYSLPMWCDIHQHYKWCEHNGGVMGLTGWEKP